MLIAEDDTVPEVWYLLGLALHAGGEFDDALTAANEAERLITLRRHEDPGAGETLLDIEDLKVHTSFQIFHAFVNFWIMRKDFQGRTFMMIGDAGALSSSPD